MHQHQGHVAQPYVSSAPANVTTIVRKKTTFSVCFFFFFFTSVYFGCSTTIGLINTRSVQGEAKQLQLPVMNCI